ncbi:hypothetical protein GCM10027431_12500 [Lysobacter rhizosphaerae]
MNALALRWIELHQGRPGRLSQGVDDGFRILLDPTRSRPPIGNFDSRRCQLAAFAIEHQRATGAAALVKRE